MRYLEPQNEKRSTENLFTPRIRSQVLLARFRTSGRQAFTLVELLIVIAIISLLLQMALPAIEMSREAARRTQCSNNLRQVALAFQLHEGAQKHLPTGGWGWYWMGDAERGFGPDQPGSWAFNILPYLEQDSLRKIANRKDGETYQRLNRQLVSTPINVLSCPSRRLPRPYPYIYGVKFPFLGIPERCARSDYASSLGSVSNPIDGRGPNSYEDAARWEVGDNPKSSWAATELNGVVFQRSRVQLQQVTDGLSHTLLAAEKYIPRASYKTGESGGDNEHLYMGYDNDLLRSTHANQRPIRDGEEDHNWRFGSAHPNTFQAAFCDGSVHVLDYGIDPKVFEAYGDRNGP